MDVGVLWNVFYMVFGWFILIFGNVFIIMDKNGYDVEVVDVLFVCWEIVVYWRFGLIGNGGLWSL